MTESSTDYIAKLEQENAELKYEIDRQKETIIYLNNSDILHKTLLQYKTALEEIREICKKVAFSNGCDNCDGIGFYDGCLDDDCGNYACFKVLDKINEVLEND